MPRKPKRKRRRVLRRYKVKGKNGIVHEVIVLPDEYPVGDGYVGMME